MCSTEIQGKGSSDNDKAADERKRLIGAKDDEGITALMKAAECGEILLCKYGF